MSKPKTLIKISETSHGKIYETPCFKDGLYFLQKEKNKPKRKLALYDLDNTILSYRHTLGTDQWFDFDFNEFIKQGLSTAKAKENTLDMYLALVNKIHPEDIYAVEEDTPAVIRQIQALDIDSLLLTSRGSYLLPQTIEQLRRFEILFNQGPYKDKEKSLPQGNESLFYQGMILTGGEHKGECLFSMLKNSEELPEYIVMWDDKLSNLEKVRNTIEEFNSKSEWPPIQFIGLRYSKLDHLIKEVKPEVIELQKRYHQRILSNEHALAILKSESKKGNVPYIDVDYRPKENCVILSLCKIKVYQLLRDLEPTIDEYKTTPGDIKTFYNKEKLAWQYQIPVNAFYPLFHQLSQHGLILQDQFNDLNPIFGVTAPVLTLGYASQLKNEKRANASDFVSSRNTSQPLMGIFSI